MEWNRFTNEPLTILKQRIAIDLDNLDYWEIYSIIDRLEVDGYDPLVWRTRHGYHIVCKLEKELSFWSILKLRSHYGDDPKRISSDIMRLTDGWPVDVLFTDSQYPYHLIR